MIAYSTAWEDLGEAFLCGFKSEEKMEAWVLVEDINSGELIATAKSNSVSGEYLVVLPSGRNYSVSANKEGFFFYSNKFYFWKFNY